MCCSAAPFQAAMRAYSAQSASYSASMSLSASILCQLFNVSVNEDGSHSKVAVSKSIPFTPMCIAWNSGESNPEWISPTRRRAAPRVEREGVEPSSATYSLSLNRPTFYP